MASRLGGLPRGGERRATVSEMRWAEETPPLRSLGCLLDLRFVLFVRDPVQRFVSLFNFWL